MMMIMVMMMAVMMIMCCESDAYFADTGVYGDDGGDGDADLRLGW